MEEYERKDEKQVRMLGGHRRMVISCWSRYRDMEEERIYEAREIRKDDRQDEHVAVRFWRSTSSW